VATGILELLGMQTKSVSSGIQCLELLAKGESFDIIFMDHMMPEMDGVETMKHIRERGGADAKVPIVLLTANAVAGVREEMLDTGFDDYLSKPIDVDELKRILVKFLGVKF
jgi:CheY-like chemotaxis protein